MSSTFRKLALLTLLCGIFLTVSSSFIQESFNRHMLRIQAAPTHLAYHDLTATDAKNLQSIIDTISKSIQPKVPSIIQTKNLPTFAFAKSTCDNLNDDQRKQTLDQVKKTKDSITSFNKNVQDDKILNDANNSFQYLSAIQTLINKKCSDITTYLLIGPTPYQTNINTKKPWILGGITMDSLVKDYINRININNNVTNCGNDTPFWNGVKCISCNDPKPIFNIATSECVSCPTGQAFDEVTRKCAPTGAKNYKPNAAAQPNILVPADAPKDALKTYMNTGTQPCPVETPFVKDNKCISCPADKPYFNIVAKECQNCPTGLSWDVATRKCVAGTKNYKPNAVAQPNVLVPVDAPKDALKTYMNTGTQPCPVETPFVKNNTCIPCPKDKPYFNLVAKQCQNCPVNFYWDVKTHTCIAGKPNATDVPLYTPKLVMNDNSTNADWDKYVKENENKIFCPADKPFWTGTQCIPCPDLFNIITRKCVVCQPGLALHTDTHKCEPAAPLQPSLKDLFNAIF